MSNNVNVIAGLPPSDYEIEKAVLSALMQDGEAYYIVSDLLSPETFYDSRHQKIYKGIQALVSASQPVDMLTVAAKVTDVDKMYIIDVYGYAKSTANIDYHARVLAQLHIQRQLGQLGISLNRDAWTDNADVDTIMQRADNKLTDIMCGKASDIVDMSDAVSRLQRHIRDNSDGITPPAITTGIPVIDIHNHGGLHETDFVLLAARTSQGKSALALDIVINALVGNQTPTFFISMEMGINQLMARIVSHSTQQSASELLYSRMDTMTAEQVINTAECYRRYPLYLAEIEGLTPELLKLKIKQSVKKYGVKLVIIDYIQILSGQRGKETASDFLGRVSRNLKDLAKSLNICILALSQLNRNTSYDEPTLSDIRASGEIAEASDLVLSLFRPDGIPGYPKVGYGDGSNISTQGTAKLSILKNRNGETNISDYMMFDGKHTHFSSVSNNDLPRISDVEARKENTPF